MKPTVFFGIALVLCFLLAGGLGLTYYLKQTNHPSAADMRVYEMKTDRRDRLLQVTESLDEFHHKREIDGGDNKPLGDEREYRQELLTLNTWISEFEAKWNLPPAKRHERVPDLFPPAKVGEK